MVWEMFAAKQVSCVRYKKRGGRLKCLLNARIEEFRATELEV